MQQSPKVGNYQSETLLAHAVSKHSLTESDGLNRETLPRWTLRIRRFVSINICD